MNIILIAPPSAGKGTYAKEIKNKYKIPHISTGELLRKVAKREDEIGEYVQETLSHGEFVKDEIVYEILEKRLSEEDCKNGYILDGFPRKLEQAIRYDELLEEKHNHLGTVLLIEVEKDLLVKRVTGRRVCSDCGAIYNINIPASLPKEDLICDNCSGKIIQRSDDNVEAFEYRYKTYLEKTKPLIEYYKSKGCLYTIDGNGDKEVVMKRIEEVLTKE